MGIPFLKRVLHKIDLHSSVDAIEDRFLPDDKPMILMILESLMKGQKIQVQKIKAVQQQIHSKTSSEQLTIQDKENINNIYEMIDKKQTKLFIESLYVKNSKNLEVTLDQFLTNNIPKDEYKVVRIDTDFIDTSSHITPAISKKDNSELLK